MIKREKRKKQKEEGELRIIVPGFDSFENRFPFVLFKSIPHELKRNVVELSAAAHDL
jgi:hypothetical protein